MHPNLRASLVAANAGAPLRYSSNKAIPSNCKHCGAVTLAGWDHPITMAAFRVVDPTPITTATEAACWLHLDRYTIEVNGWPGGWRFGTLRTHPKVATIFGGPHIKGHVLPEHKCGQLLTTELLQLTSSSATYPDIPPY